MIKKIFSLFFILLLIINIASATRFVNYNLREGRINGNGDFRATDVPVNDVNAVGYICLDKGCENLGKKIFSAKEMTNGFPTAVNQILNSGDNSFMQLFYPTELLSNFGYAVYYYKDGFIPWESNPNWFGTNANDPQGSYNVYLSKKEVCSSEITEVKIRNSERANTPVVIDVKADLDAKTKAAINEGGPLKAVPEDLKEHYSVRTLVNLDIVDEEGIKVYSDEQEVLIGFGNKENVEFEFVPGGSGSFTALVTTRVTDEKCLESEDQFDEKEFVVLGENPLNACYTDLSDLELSSFNVKPGHDLLLKLNKISNFQESIENEIIVPIKTFLDVQLFNELGEAVNEKTFNLGANENSVDLKNVELLFNIPEDLETGIYQLRITGKGNHPGCFDQKISTLNEEIFVEEDGLLGNAPRIISTPIKKAKLGGTYVYDVEAIDLDNDELTYTLLFGPKGMTMNSETGLVTWNVDKNKFEEDEKHMVLLSVTDGLFVDAQFFFITIEGIEEEREENKEHKFIVSGLDLEFSDNENGIVGFLLLKNGGDFKENKVSVYADIYELDVHEVLTNNVNLGQKDSFWIPIDVKVPSNTKEGEYLVNVRVENNKNREEHRFVAFIENKNKENARVITRA